MYGPVGNGGTSSLGRTYGKNSGAITSPKPYSRTSFDLAYHDAGQGLLMSCFEMEVPCGEYYHLWGREQGIGLILRTSASGWRSDGLSVSWEDTFADHLLQGGMIFIAVVSGSGLGYDHDMPRVHHECLPLPWLMKEDNNTPTGQSGGGGRKRGERPRAAGEEARNVGLQEAYKKGSRPPQIPSPSTQAEYLFTSTTTLLPHNYQNTPSTCRSPLSLSSSPWASTWLPLLRLLARTHTAPTNPSLLLFSSAMVTVTWTETATSLCPAAVEPPSSDPATATPTATSTVFPVVRRTLSTARRATNNLPLLLSVLAMVTWTEMVTSSLPALVGWLSLGPATATATEMATVSIRCHRVGA
ncbi:hypothetical protein G7K_6739-t1 [Saitoella complicata NRRL Y-17804]|uniref:Uncharacterized protein n=1 Tax=Saitoella complicata (strain BCRC 22490 / CBS 7301 / JCM 7358 / NBRC 10748 / NRRL Y-17804) TaxID=698492 RepID=A0A0E9NS09_SAICN|nr:hypothetical protein G7K_6739-t1 [Saitoella complicata NRRL Y-17804]